MSPEDFEAYSTDPLVRATWDCAVIFMDNLGLLDKADPDALEDPRVVDLKDWILRAYETGLQRTRKQDARLDEVLTNINKQQTPTLMVCHDCPKAKAIAEVMP